MRHLHYFFISAPFSTFQERKKEKNNQKKGEKEGVVLNKLNQDTAAIYVHVQSVKARDQWQPYSCTPNARSMRTDLIVAP